MAAASQTDREDNTPFLLRLFCRQGAFHRPEEFASRSLQPSVSVYTWPSCSLSELACQIASERPSLLPHPSIGTRLAFRLFYPDTRGGANASNHDQPRFMSRDMGSVVIGEGAGGSHLAEDDDVEMGDRSPPPPFEEPSDGDITLEQNRYVIGDYVSCAILPPLPDGSVVPEQSAWRDRPGPGPSRGGGGPGGFRGDVSFGRGNTRGRRGGFGDVPSGDWRRGERLPDEGRSRPAGRGGRRWR
ncbi:Sin3 associated polypeptide p18 [Plectosphaerella plurivora]|uniref:Sin3 associated polypeptide p18 n=1 Tax=Plectosphaerella plurivora TaxID=936078 RepID=A0A9P8VD30_9PEZI|nr:Sin3 associated polypeptide p18 [Plectosphaerella plurivora]